MFERATIFSSVFIFIFFSVIAWKYFAFVETKNQVTLASFITLSN